ncbi:MAG: hypothetical protein U0270_33645 [Labilithrix sp.]
MATAALDAKVSVSFSPPGGGERVVLRSEIPPEAEFAMFEIGEIELGAHEPGRGVRELGYQTTAADARKRLANLGLSGAVAREVAQAFQPVLSDAYARGTACKRVARYLGPLELFRAESYDTNTRLYRGTFIDLAALSHDLELDHASATLQALYLASLLETENDDTTILINTDLCTKGSKPGTRTFKRPIFVEIQRLMNALGGLSHKNPQPEITDTLPRVEVVDWLRYQQETAPDEDSRALYKSLEAAVSVREMPEKGPLASPELWQIEERIEKAQYEGTLDAVDNFERTHGRTPGTTYLRARISLELRLEPPKLIAERVSALSLSMTSFQELALLASEAWLEAGDPRRAMPYARDLVDSPTIDEGLRLKAQTLLQRAETNKPKRRMSPTLADPIRAPLPRRQAPDEMPTPVPPPMEPEPMPAPEAEPFADAIDLDDSAQRAAEPVALGIEDLVLDETPPAPAMAAKPARSLPPPIPSSRSMRAAPPLPSSSRRMPAAPPVEPPASANRISGAAPTIDEVAIPDIPVTEPNIPNDRPSSFPALRAQRPAAAEPAPLSIPPPLELDLSPGDQAASFTLELPGPDAAPEPAPMSAPAPRRRMSGMITETRPPSSYDPRAEPDSPVVPRGGTAPEIRSVPPAPQKTPSRPAPARRASVKPSEPHPFEAAQPFEAAPPVDDGFGAFGEEDPADRDEPTPPRLDAPALPLITPHAEEPHTQPSLPPAASSQEMDHALEPAEGALTANNATTRPPKPEEPAASLIYMRGASMPPYRLENPAPLLAKAPLLPKVQGDELAEHLALPTGVSAEGRALDTLPTSVLEARIQFTLLSRELGLDYRLKRGIELRADVTGIESMQAVLAEMFPERIVKTKDDAFEVRRHGAFLSEILARRLDAEWMDISAAELGHWVMIVPPDTRIWPFGRVGRFIAMGQKERDLVSYFFELTSRAGKR